MFHRLTFTCACGLTTPLRSAMHLHLAFGSILNRNGLLAGRTEERRESVKQVYGPTLIAESGTLILASANLSPQAQGQQPASCRIIESAAEDGSDTGANRQTIKGMPPCEKL
ncbi:hypothetical protein KCU81_g669, partial [Aureobasidium melanogenum]